MSDDSRLDGAGLPALVGTLSVVACSYLVIGLLASLPIAVALSEEQTNCVTIGSSDFCDTGTNVAVLIAVLAAGSFVSVVGTAMLLAFRQIIVYLHDINGAVGESIQGAGPPPKPKPDIEAGTRALEVEAATDPGATTPGSPHVMDVIVETRAPDTDDPMVRLIVGAMVIAATLLAAAVLYILL